MHRGVVHIGNLLRNEWLVGLYVLRLGRRAPTVGVARSRHARNEHLSAIELLVEYLARVQLHEILFALLLLGRYLGAERLQMRALRLLVAIEIGLRLRVDLHDEILVEERHVVQHTNRIQHAFGRFEFGKAKRFFCTGNRIGGAFEMPYAATNLCVDVQNFVFL